MSTKIVAFDIDGTLTDDKTRAVYRKLEQKVGVKVGVITSRSRPEAEKFLDEHDLSYEFLDANLLKFFPLRARGITFSGNPEIYVGNTVRDMFTATLTGWEFIHVSRVDEAL